MAVVEVDSPAAVEYQALDGKGRIIGSGRTEDLAAPLKTDSWDKP